MRYINYNKRGAVLAFVIIIGAALFILVAMATSAANASISISDTGTKAREAYINAKSGIEFSKVLVTNAKDEVTNMLTVSPGSIVNLPETERHYAYYSPVTGFHGEQGILNTDPNFVNSPIQITYDINHQVTVNPLPTTDGSISYDYNMLVEITSIGKSYRPSSIIGFLDKGTTLKYNIEPLKGSVVSDPPVGATPVNLGAAGNYVILAKSGITNAPYSVITGDIGVSPVGERDIVGFSLTRDATNTFSTSTQITGKAYAANYASPTPENLTKAVTAMETAYNDAASRTGQNINLSGGKIGGQTFSAGVYKLSTGVLINSNVTLNGGVNDVWIFQIVGKITQVDGTKIILSGGAQAKNIFWQSSGTVTIGKDAHFAGIILGKTSIVLGANASIIGRLLVQTKVTLNKNTVEEPLPSVTTHFIPTSIATMGGIYK